MKARGASAWQVVLSDLALILFLTALAAAGNQHGASDDHAVPTGEMAIYREGAGGLTLAQWLDQQPADPRIQLTVQARYAATDFDRVADRAAHLAQQAAARGYMPRLSLQPAAQSEVTGSLAYDALPGQCQALTTRLRPASFAR